MLDYVILKNKPEFVIKDKDGTPTYCKDLLAKSFSGECIEDLNVEPLIVPKDYIARPDLISLAKYGDDKYADLICKLNGISNPFELNEGTILFLPQLEYMVQSMSRLTTNVASVLASESDNIGVQHMTKQKSKTEDRSPNQQTKGETNYYIDTANGRVFY